MCFEKYKTNKKKVIACISSAKVFDENILI